MGGEEHIASKFRPSHVQRQPKLFNPKNFKWAGDKYLHAKYSKRPNILTPFYLANVLAYRAFRFPGENRIEPERYYFKKKFAAVNGPRRVRFIPGLKTLQVFGRKPYSLIERGYWQV